MIFATILTTRRVSDSKARWRVTGFAYSASLQRTKATRMRRVRWMTAGKCPRALNMQAMQSRASNVAAQPAQPLPSPYHRLCPRPRHLGKRNRMYKSLHKKLYIRRKKIYIRSARPQTEHPWLLTFFSQQMNLGRECGIESQGGHPEETECMSLCMRFIT